MTKWHGGKGSAPRPIEDRTKFESNWDRIFNKNKTPDGMWDHYCKHNGKTAIAKGEPCSWCGESE